MVDSVERVGCKSAVLVCWDGDVLRSVQQHLIGRVIVDEYGMGCMAVLICALLCCWVCIVLCSGVCALRRLARFVWS